MRAGARADRVRHLLSRPPSAGAIAIPGFWDPRRRPERPDLSRITLIRFLTEIDYPPFNYAGPDGNPAGFNVDLARMICEELKIACTIQMRRFDTLLDALDENRGDAVMASIAVTPEARTRVDFSDPYYRTPARFVARRDASIDGRAAGARLKARRSRSSPAPRTRPISRRCSPKPSCAPIRHRKLAREALRAGDVDLLFGDGISLAFWLNGTESGGCCVVRRRAVHRKPLSSAKASASRSSAATTRCGRRFNWALFRLWEKGSSPTCGCAISRSARLMADAP